MAKTVNCPTCLKAVPWTTDSQFRPFCSERCKLIDFGDWASGKHAIAGEAVPDHGDDPEPNGRDDFLPN
ncbi:MAG: DNA gyrase inhibitor YacG [Gammaproteobacteria bacterium]|nr:DNA gyrase inhibitor YacG [Gammaproteobacteria bacterium]